MSRWTVYWGWWSSKALLQIAGHDVEKAAGPQQVCASQVGEYEVAVHAMHQIFLDSETEGVLLVNVTNAFVQKKTSKQLPTISLSRILMNMYT